MSERYSSAVIWSALLHGLAFALVFLATYLGGRLAKPGPVIFELVAGEGDNFTATEAPALGEAGGSGVTIPEPPRASPPLPQPVKAPAAAPDVVLVTPAPKAAPPTKAAPATKAPAPKADPKPAVADNKSQKMTLEEFNKQNKGKAPAATKAAAPAARAPIPRVGEGIAKGVMGGSTKNTTGGAGGTAMTAAERSAVAGWEAGLRQRLFENFVRPDDVSDQLVARVQINYTPAGLISGAVVTSSGNAAFDRAVNNALQKTRMPERPDKKGGTVYISFRIVDMPEGGN